MKDVLQSRNLTRWYELLENSDLLDELGNARNMTMFVPTRAALDAPEAELLLTGRADKEAVRDVLRYHMAQYKLEADDMSNGQVLDSHATGRPLRINLYSTVSVAERGLLLTFCTQPCSPVASKSSASTPLDRSPSWAAP